MERLGFGESYDYNATESSIHLARYALAKNLCKDKKVLDIACGEGYGTYLLSKWGAKSVEGVDISNETIKKARNLFKATNINYVCHTAEQLDYEDSCFDLVISLETIEHLDEPHKFLQEIKRVLRPDGVLILSCPNDEYFVNVGGAPENQYHKQSYSFDEFSNMIESYFGGNCDYYLGYAVGGFINMPISRCNSNSNYNSINSFQMFRYNKRKNDFAIPSHYNLSKENCSYYIGIWGKNEDIDGNSVIFAKDQCNQQADLENKMKTLQIESLKKDIIELNNCIEELKNSVDFQSKQEKTFNNNDNVSIELERAKLLLRLSEKEKNIVTENLNRNWLELCNYKEEIDKCKEELYNIYNSKTFRCMKHIYRINGKLQKLRKRDDNPKG